MKDRDFLVHLHDNMIDDYVMEWDNTGMWKLRAIIANMNPYTESEMSFRFTREYLEKEDE